MMNKTLILQIHPEQISKCDNTMVDLVTSLSGVFSRYCNGNGYSYKTAVPRLSLVQSSAWGGNPPVQPVSQSRVLGEILQVHLPLPDTTRFDDTIPEKPHFSLILTLDTEILGDLLFETSGQLIRRAHRRTASNPREVSQGLLDAATRLLKLQEQPADIPVLAPMLEREILYWVLRSDRGEQLCALTRPEDKSRNIDRAIRWVKQNFRQPFCAEEVARTACMSQTSLYKYFKEVTSMTPLQYQKQLRLHEARRLMFVGAANASTAGYKVGYISPSQFSREYNRLFGKSPAKDIARLRESVAALSLSSRNYLPLQSSGKV